MSESVAPRGAKITEMDACDLIGRLVINSHGAEYVVTRLSFDAGSACVLIWLSPTPDERAPDIMGDDEVGLMDLDGWSIHQKLRKEDV